jgi:hypothetical protein
MIVLSDKDERSGYNIVNDDDDRISYEYNIRIRMSDFLCQKNSFCLFFIFLIQPKLNFAKKKKKKREKKKPPYNGSISHSGLNHNVLSLIYFI